MDYQGALDELYRERQQLDQVIRNLEALANGRSPAPISRRGRKSMPDEERKIVAERMRNYWASRRQQKAGRLSA